MWSVSYYCRGIHHNYIVTAQLLPNTKLVLPHNWMEPTPPATQSYKVLPDNVGCGFSVYVSGWCNFIVTIQINLQLNITQVVTPTQTSSQLNIQNRWNKFQIKAQFSLYWLWHTSKLPSYNYKSHGWNWINPIEPGVWNVPEFRLLAYLQIILSSDENTFNGKVIKRVNTFVWAELFLIR